MEVEVVVEVVVEGGAVTFVVVDVWEVNVVCCTSEDGVEMVLCDVVCVIAEVDTELVVDIVVCSDADI